jgi:hypothetical protein
MLERSINPILAGRVSLPLRYFRSGQAFGDMLKKNGLEKLEPLRLQINSFQPSRSTSLGGCNCYSSVGSDFFLLLYH